LTRRLLITITAILALTIFLFDSAAAHPAWGIAVDQQGQVYFSDLETVWKIDARGKVSIFRAGKDHIHDLNLDEAGNLYGAENSYDSATQRFFSAVWKMTPSGDFSYLLAPTENPPTGTSIWKDRDGNTYLVTNFPQHELLVLKRTPNGTVTPLVGSSDAARTFRQGAPYSLGGMAIAPDGSLYFVHGANVSKWTTNGGLTPLVRNVVVENSGKPAGASQLFGLAIDAEGNVFVADHGNRRILKIAPDGQLTTPIRAEESWFPTGVAVKGGELYILEESHTPAYQPIGTRVRKLSPDGRVTVLATVGENGVLSGGPSTAETSSAKGSEGSSKSHQRALYVVLSAAGILTFVIIVWLVRGRISNRQQRNQP
jgi:sugar lactone lactonase YvrE